MAKIHQKNNPGQKLASIKDTKKLKSMTYRMPYEVQISLKKYAEKFNTTTDTGAINHCILNSTKLIESNNNLSMMNFELQGKLNEYESLINPLKKYIRKLIE